MKMLFFQVLASLTPQLPRCRRRPCGRAAPLSTAQTHTARGPFYAGRLSLSRPQLMMVAAEGSMFDEKLFSSPLGSMARGRRPQQSHVALALALGV